MRLDEIRQTLAKWAGYLALRQTTTGKIKRQDYEQMIQELHEIVDSAKK